MPPGNPGQWVRSGEQKRVNSGERQGGVTDQIDVGQIAGDFAGGSDATIAARVGAEVGDLVPVGERLAVRTGGDVDRGDVELAQGGQFVALADAVLVEVAPQAQFGEARIERADLAVGVAVEIAQGVEAVGRALTIALDRRVAEELAPRIDQAVQVAVEDEEAVVGAQPAGRGAGQRSGRLRRTNL